jgi:hypothetical protein
MKTLINIVFLGAVAWVMCYVLAFAWVFTVPYFKVTDPHDPKFDAMQFRFEDYYWIHEPKKPEDRDFYEQVFIGLKKEQIDEIFRRNGGGWQDVSDELLKKDIPGAKSAYMYVAAPWWRIFFVYRYPIEGLSFGIIVVFDENNQAISRL